MKRNEEWLEKRVARLKRGDYQFGHGGRHHGNGSKDCPKELHHHHDEYCDRPSLLELQLAGIDPKTFRVQSRR